LFGRDWADEKADGLLQTSASCPTGYVRALANRACCAFVRGVRVEDHQPLIAIKYLSLAGLFQEDDSF